MATSKEKKRKLPVKLTEVELDGDYEGWSFTYRANPPMGKWGKGAALAASFDENNPSSLDDVIEGMYMVLEAVITDWNFVDEKGNELPCNREGFEALPFNLLQEVFQRVNVGISEAPLVGNSK